MKYITFILLLFISFNINANDFDKGLSAYNSGDYEEAVKWWKRAADQGSAKAQLSLGIAYELGRGVKKDEEEAVKYYREFGA